MLGPEQAIDLYLYDDLPMDDMLKGLQAELYDCAFPLLRRVVVTSNLDIAFKDTEFAFLLSAKLRKPYF